MLSENFASDTTPFPAYLLFSWQTAQPALICPGGSRDGSASFPSGRDESVEMWSHPFLRPRRQEGMIVTVEEEVEYHTLARPYCPDLTCPICHNNPEYHFQQTGSPTSDNQDTTERTGPLGAEMDDDWFEAAMALLGAK